MSKATRMECVLFAGLAAVAMVAATGMPAMAGSDDSSSARVTTSLSGGAQKSIFVRTRNSVSFVFEGAFQIVPDSTVGNFIVASNDSDLFTVLFAGEAELRNASVLSSNAFNNDDVLELQARVVNNTTGAVINMQPVGPTSFAGSNDQEAHAMQWAIRLGTGSWRFQIIARVRDVSPFSAVSAQLDDWSMTITRFN